MVYLRPAIPCSKQEISTLTGRCCLILIVCLSASDLRVRQKLYFMLLFLLGRIYFYLRRVNLSTVDLFDLN